MDATNIDAQPPDDASPRKRAADRPRKVFISYAREDEKFALRLKHSLEAERVAVWSDTEIHGGGEWMQNIEEALEASTEFFLIASPHSKASKYVRKELTSAIDDDKTIVPLKVHRYGKWPQIIDYQYIDFRGRYDEAFEELMCRTPPPRTLWRDVLIVLAKISDFRSLLTVFVIALAIAVTACAYFLWPSNTSFSVSGGEKSIKVLLHNRGGRPSMLMGSSFRLSFGSLPIEAEPLFLVHPETPSRIVGHSDAEIELTAGTLTPQKKSEDCYFTKDDIEPLLAAAKVTLTAQVKESDDRLQTRSEEFPAERIKNFILEVYPDDVPCQPR